MKTAIDEPISTSNTYLFAPALRGEDVTPLPVFASSIAPPSAGRYWRTLKHLRTSQLFYLVWHRRLSRNDLSPWPNAYVNLKVCHCPPRIAEWEPELARQIIQAGDVRFVEPSIKKSYQAPWWAGEIARRQSN